MLSAPASSGAPGISFIKNNLLLKKALSELAAQPLRLVRRSWRVSETRFHPEAEALIRDGKPVIYALWHGRMYALLKAVPMDRTAVLVSPSNDGELITRVARRIGFRHFVRGSHKRGGVQAMRALRKALVTEGHSIIFTVDGPRGPRYRVKSGLIRLAGQTGAPVIPLASSARWLLRKFDRAWDHFHAPLPFTELSLLYGQPLRIAPDLSDDAYEESARVLEESLFQLHREADAIYGLDPEVRL